MKMKLKMLLSICYFGSLLMAVFASVAILYIPSAYQWLSANETLSFLANSELKNIASVTLWVATIWLFLSLPSGEKINKKGNKNP